MGLCDPGSLGFYTYPRNLRDETWEKSYPTWLNGGGLITYQPSAGSRVLLSVLLKDRERGRVVYLVQIVFETRTGRPDWLTVWPLVGEDR